MKKKWWTFALAGLVLAALVTGGMALAGVAGSSGCAVRANKGDFAGKKLAQENAEEPVCSECLRSQRRDEKCQENCEGNEDATPEGNCEKNRDRVENRGDQTMNRNCFSEHERSCPADGSSCGCEESVRDRQRLRDQERVQDRLRESRCNECGDQQHRGGRTSSS